MRLDKVKWYLDRVLVDGDMKMLARLARDLGRELPRKRLEVLNEFRAILAGFIADDGRLSHDEFHKMCLEAVNKFRTILGEPIPVEGEYVLGYLTALCDVTAAYSAAILPEVQDEEALTFLRANGFGSVMLALLSGQLKSLDQLIQDIAPPQTSAEKLEGVMEKINKEIVFLLYNLLATSHDDGKRPAVYSLTLCGERLAKKLAP